MAQDRVPYELRLHLKRTTVRPLLQGDGFLCRLSKSGIVSAMTGFWDLSNGAKVLLAICSVVVLVEGGYLYFLQTQGALAGVGSTCEYVIGEWEAAEPEAAAPKEKYTGDIAEVKFDDTRFPEAKEFKSAITTVIARGANFAGHYALAEWECGTSCQDHAVVDVQTGEIVAFGIPSEAGLSFLPESALIMTNPAPNFPTFADLQESSFADQVYWFNIPREYYVLEEDSGRATVSRLCIENAYDGQR